MRKTEGTRLHGRSGYECSAGQATFTWTHAYLPIQSEQTRQWIRFEWSRRRDTNYSSVSNENRSTALEEARHGNQVTG